MSFTALGAYEVPSLWGPPLIYGRIYEVALQRPDRLRVITVGDGPRTEFYDDGKVMMSFHPAENLVAVTDAPPTIDGALEKLFDVSGTYFPFTDVVVADPWGDMQPGSDRRVLRRRVDAHRRHDDRRRRLRRRRRLHPDVDRQRRQASPHGARPVPRRSAAAAAVRPVLRTGSSIRRSPPDGFTTAKAAAADKIAFNHPRMKSGDCPPAPSPIGSGAKKKTPAQAAPKADPGPTRRTP